MGLLARWRRRRIERLLADHPLDDAAWEAAVAAVPMLAALDAAHCAALRELATRFVHAKRFAGANDLDIDDAVRVGIAAQACLPVLGLGFDWLRGWTSVIVYPESFVVDLAEQDTDGVVHEGPDERVGESWERGPLVLSWADAAPGVEPHGEGTNLVVHEIAHKLDQLDGDANGCPPLHPEMDRGTWQSDFRAAYEALCREVDAGVPTWIDPYAAAAPDEFFAVLSEHFFCAPDALRVEAPAVYRQLAAFYRQDPTA